MACSRFRRAAEELGDVGQRRRRVTTAVVIRCTLSSTHCETGSGGVRRVKHRVLQVLSSPSILIVHGDYRAGPTPMWALGENGLE